MHLLINQKKVVGRRDYWTVDIHYGEYQGKRRYVIEKDINAEDGVESMSDAIKWFNDFVDENERELAFADGEITHTSVALVEDEDGDVEEDWYDVEEICAKSLHWDRSYLEDDDDDDDDDETAVEEGKDEISD